MTEQLFLKESTGFDSASQRPSDQTRSSIIDELFDLAASRNLDTMLSKAVGTVVRLFGAEAGSILFHGRSLYRVRSGAFRQEVLGRIQHWEDVIGKRLQTTSWRIAESAKLPISVSKLAKPQLILINTPLVANAGLVVGSLSLVLSPSSGLTQSQRHLLGRTSTGIGQMAALIADLEFAQQRLEQMNVFYKVGQVLMSTLDVNRLLAETMRFATEVIDAGAASLMLIDDDHQELVFEVSLGSRSHILRQQRIPLDEGIAGWVARTGEPAIVNNARTDPRFSHRVDVRTGFLTQSIAAVPVKIKGRVIGVLEVLNKYSDTGFNEEDLRLMSSIAAQSAIAIENARLYQQVRQERDHIIQAQEEVRRELNRKLHDGPIQLLSAISMSLDHLERMNEVNPEAVRSQIDALHDLVNQTTRDARTILFELRPLILETQGLVAALEQYVSQLRDSESFKLHFQTVPRVNFDAKIGGTIFSIVQEAINNIRRHASARNVWLILETKKDNFVVTIRDDGKGFEPGQIIDGYDNNNFGLTNMRERAELIGAELKIDSRLAPPNRGTMIQLILPLPEVATVRNPLENS
jgi:signal transduction histidine kinase